MLRLFRSLRRGRRLLRFKKLRMGFTLLKSAFKAIIFEHQRYFWFCLTLALIQIVQALLTSVFDPTLRVQQMLSEVLAGQSYIPLLFARRRACPLGFVPTIMQSFVLFCQTLLTLFVTTATVHYSAARLRTKAPSVRASFRVSLQKHKILSAWALLELMLSLLFFSLGLVGDILQVLWQVSTALSVQVITLGHADLVAILKRSFAYFKRMLGSVISIDILIDLLIVAASIITYFIYSLLTGGAAHWLTALPLEQFLNNIWVDVVIFYLLSALVIAETIALTGVYILAFVEERE